MYPSFGVLLLIILSKQCSGVIYYLNDTEYDRMPPIYAVDNYKECLQKDSDVYCVASFSLVSDEPSDLLNMIKEYSEIRVTHYNHSKLRYGICTSQKCQFYIQNKTAVTTESLEGCLNQSIWRDYKLKTKIKNRHCYSLADHNVTVEADDIFVAVLIISILMLNVIGSVRDNECISNSKERSIWSCFSIRRNWKKLVSNSTSSDPRLQRLKGIDGMRSIIVVGVIIVHCGWPFYVTLRNAHDLELNFYDLTQYIILNGSVALQTYLVISGFLMTYKMQLYSEKETINWRLVPKGILLRYFRLTPVYAIIIALLSTWIKFIGPGPFWDVAGNMVRANCRKHWWQNLLYINNYVYDVQCVLVAWYLGVDMQMFILGIITSVALKNKGHRAIVLTTLFIIGIILPAVHIYVRDLDPTLMFSPGQTRSLLRSDPTFNETYKMGHANVASYIVGLALGYLVYKWQQLDIDIEKYKKYRYIYWTLPLFLAGIMLLGKMFYRDAPRDPVYIRVLYGALAKPIYGVIVAIILCGMIFKLESIYRTILEWRIWAIPGRLSYIMYIIHVPYLRVYVSLMTDLLTFSPMNQILALIGVGIVSFLTAIPLWLFVEAPFVELTRYWTRQNDEPKETVTDSCQEKIENNNTNL